LRSTACLAVITVVCVLVPLWAHAHGSADTLPRFWMGVQHLITAPLPLAASIGLGVTVAFASVAATWLAICAAGLAACIVAATEPIAFAGAPALAVIAITGITSISGWNPPAWFALLVALATGAVAAAASNVGLQHWDAALGLGAMVVVISGWAAKILQYARSLPQLREVAPIARQVIGAWATAIAMLLAMAS
jgi:hypothetical protein